MTFDELKAYIRAAAVPRCLPYFLTWQIEEIRRAGIAQVVFIDEANDRRSSAGFDVNEDWCDDATRTAAYDDRCTMALLNLLSMKPEHGTVYEFREIDSGRVYYVNWETAMNSAAQRLTLPNGREAIRVQHSAKRPTKAEPAAVDQLIVNSGHGCIVDQVEELREEARRHGFTAIEWKEDPKIPGWYDLHTTSRDQWERWQQHRQMPGAREHNGAGASLTPEALADAERRVREKYGVKEPTACQQ